MGGVFVLYEDGSRTQVGKIRPGMRHMNHHVDTTVVDATITFDPPIETTVRLASAPAKPLPAGEDSREPANKGPRKPVNKGPGKSGDKDSRAPARKDSRTSASKGPRKTNSKHRIDGKKHGCYVKGCSFTAKCPGSFKRHFFGTKGKEHRARHPRAKFDLKKIKESHMTDAEAEKWVGVGGKKGTKTAEPEDEIDDDEQMDEDEDEDDGDEDDEDVDEEEDEQMEQDEVEWEGFEDEVENEEDDDEMVDREEQ